jgi:hypothetical protein
MHACVHMNEYSYVYDYLCLYYVSQQKNYYCVINNNYRYTYCRTSCSRGRGGCTGWRSGCRTGRCRWVGWSGIVAGHLLPLLYLPGLMMCSRVDDVVVRRQRALAGWLRTLRSRWRPRWQPCTSHCCGGV